MTWAVSTLPLSLLGAEVFSRILDFKDRTTCVLFGDGAGAVVLGASATPGILATELHADGRHAGILCVPGTVSADVRYDVAYERAQAALRELAPEAEALGVFIGVENVWNKFLLSPLEMAHFVDEIDSAYVGVYFDAGNVLAYGYPQHWIEILGPRIKKVHVKDFQIAVGNLQGFANPLQGDVPWAAVRTALDGIGYSGFVTAEVSGYPAAPTLGLRHIAEALRQFFK